MTTSEAMTAAAAALGLVVPEPCVEGVLRNIELLAAQAELLGGFDLEGLPVPPAVL